MTLISSVQSTFIVAAEGFVGSAPPLTPRLMHSIAWRLGRPLTAEETAITIRTWAECSEAWLSTLRAIRPQTEMNLARSITVEPSVVLVAVGKDPYYFGFTPEQARRYAEDLIKAAAECEALAAPKPHEADEPLATIARFSALGCEWEVSAESLKKSRHALLGVGGFDAVRVVSWATGLVVEVIPGGEAPTPCPIASVVG